MEENAIVIFEEVVGGIEASKASQIKNTFEPMVKMLEGFEDRYNKVLSMEMSEDACKAAKRLRLDIGQVRIKAEKNRKEQKQEYLLAGKAIDGVNNILKFAVSERETKLKDIENYYENLEKEMIENNRVERIEELRTLDPDFEEPVGLGTWEDETYKMFFDGTKKRLEDEATDAKRIQEEEEVKQRVIDLHTKRVVKCSRIAYLIEDFENINFGIMPDEEFESLVTASLNKERLEIEEEAHLYNIAFNDEKVLTDKADLFVKRLLKDNYEKRRRGDYIKKGLTISYDALKVMNKREFNDIVKNNNNIINSENNKIQLAFEIEADKINVIFDLQVEALEEDKTFNKNKAEIENKAALEAAAALAPDKDKLIKMANDFKVFLKSQNIKLESGEANDIKSFFFGHVEEHIRDLVKLSNEL